MMVEDGGQGEIVRKSETDRKRNEGGKEVISVLIYGKCDAWIRPEIIIHGRNTL